VSLSSYAARNRELWDRRADDYQQAHQQQLAASGGAAWGVWQLPESQIGALGDVRGKDALEFGCGAAQWSIALHKLGARITGLDNSERQLAHARSLMASAGVDFPLVHASAESTGLAGASFDIVFCDHGAITFCDPYLSVPEAARLLRPGGLLAFSMHTPIIDIAWPLGTDHPAERIRLFRENGLVVEDLLELRPPADATSSYRNDDDREWARRWPMEHIWRVRRRG
jgi:SAM-dependent methyltransferase